MMTVIFRTASAVTASVCLFALGGCATGTNQNFDTYGDPLDPAEITQAFSGSFLPFRAGPNGTYFAPNGDLNSLRGGGAIGIGTWGAGERGICMEETSYYRQDGQVAADPPFSTCYFVFMAEDGTIILDPVGAGPNLVLRPGTIQSGFAGQGEFNRLRADLGV